MVYAQPSICPRNDTNKLPWDFNKQADHLILARRPDLVIISKKEENSQNLGLFCHSNVSEKPSANTDVKNSQGVNNNNNNKTQQDKTQQNSKCRLCGDGDETINHIISEYRIKYRESIRRDTTGSARRFIGKCVKNLYSTILTNGICTTQHLS